MPRLRAMHSLDLLLELHQLLLPSLELVLQLGHPLVVQHLSHGRQPGAQLRLLRLQRRRGRGRRGAGALQRCSGGGCRATGQAAGRGLVARAFAVPAV
jgi:hypothetical protein